eukprot:327005-Rhodomonas_salina.1
MLVPGSITKFLSLPHMSGQVRYRASVGSHPCYAMSGTDVAYALTFAYAMSAMRCAVRIWHCVPDPTLALCDVRYSDSVCCWAMSGTEILYAAHARYRRNRQARLRHPPRCARKGEDFRPHFKNFARLAPRMVFLRPANGGTEARVSGEWWC